MQQVLPVLQTHSHRLDNFIIAENDTLIRHLSNALENGAHVVSPSQTLTFIYGSAGSGKSHLLLACHDKANKLKLHCQYIDIEQLIHLPSDVLDGVASKQVLLIDNLHLISHNTSWQVKVFDTINQFLELQGRCLLISANQPLANCGFSLPDLRSRLQWGTIFQVKELSDASKLEALKHHFRERGITVEDRALSYLLNHANREMHKLMQFALLLDEKSLESKRKMTIPFIKETLFS